MLLLFGLGVCGFATLNSMNREKTNPDVQTQILIMEPGKELSDNLYGKQIARIFTAKVTGVTDGDSITVQDGSNERININVQLDSIDAPEIGQAYGAKAKEALSIFCDGEIVEVLVTGEDQDGDTLAFVIFEGLNLNVEMVRHGIAWRDSSSNNDELSQMQDEAKKTKTGLWANPKVVPPWEWRRQELSNGE